MECRIQNTEYDRIMKVLRVYKERDLYIRIAPMSVWLIFVFLISTIEFIEAGVQSDKDAELSVSIDEYKEKVAYEKKILEGLKKLLEIKQNEVILPDEITNSELVIKNENLSISKIAGNYDAVLYSISAKLVPMEEILQTLVSTSERKLIIDEDIDKEKLTSVISIFMEDVPLIDIIDVILGAKGLESIISEEIMFVTLPAKLNVVSSYDYYQEKAVQAYQKAMIKYPSYKEIARAYYELGNFLSCLGISFNCIARIQGCN
ncbi:MAG: N-acetylglucosaminyltransferase (O-GlcNAc transferase) [Candidatus Scalindua rubra]|uniref:N-acetylglucosaminyltransferase (O-GlcNAc transferase) n=1 Tax=Candidatus Scalindua rubra TaxID=1872076 RepID=A0A1E3XDA2_9BACT|nr:MAG: N-acetylglucosaminyltransferase (O-GlcNAc transferase) [Candidatus Scalindua rubra]